MLLRGTTEASVISGIKLRFSKKNHFISPLFRGSRKPLEAHSGREGEAPRRHFFVPKEGGFGAFSVSSARGFLCGRSALKYNIQPRKQKFLISGVFVSLFGILPLILVPYFEGDGCGWLACLPTNRKAAFRGSRCDGGGWEAK